MFTACADARRCGAPLVMTLKGRRFFFATAEDLRPGLRRAEETLPVAYVLNELRDDPDPPVYRSLTEAPGFGSASSGSVAQSAQYLVFRRAEVPTPRAVVQRRGGLKYAIEPSSDSVILRCGGLHEASGALVAGELQRPLHPADCATAIFELYATELFRGYHRIGIYCVGPDALRGLRSGQRLVTIGVRSPREYDLVEK